MKTLFFLSFLTALVGFQFNSDKNSIKGKVSIPKQTESVIEKGSNYQKNVGQASEEKKRIDRLNQASLNIYISLHPMDFVPELKETSNVQITQRAKTFFPNIVAITKGSTIQFINEDEHYHNVFSLTPKARFNIGRRPTGNVYNQKINKLGVVKLGCDIHEEMSATILSLDTPYFTKINADGTYEINSLPDGKYEVRIYHPQMVKYKEEIILEGGKPLIKDFNIEPKA